MTPDDPRERFDEAVAALRVELEALVVRMLGALAWLPLCVEAMLLASLLGWLELAPETGQPDK